MTDQQQRPLATLHVANIGARARRGIGRTRVPLADDYNLHAGARVLADLDGETSGRGVLIGDQVLRPDGFARTASLEFNVGQFASGRSQFAILGNAREDGTGDAEIPLPPFGLHPWIGQRLGLFGIDVMIDGRRVPLHLQPVATTSMHATSRFYGRCDATGFWASVWTETPTATPYQTWALRVGFNDERMPDALHTELVRGIELHVRGAFPVVRYRQQSGIGVQVLEDGTSVVQIGGAGLWGDSQAPVVTGAFLFPPGEFHELDEQLWAPPAEWLLAEADDAPLEYVCSAFGAARAFGPAGTVTLPDWFNGDPQHAQVAAHRHAVRAVDRMPRTAGLFAWGPDSCLEIPGTAGDQADFGVSQLCEVALIPEAPERLYASRFSALAEGCRPGHYRELDVSPVTHANHPQWFCYLHVTHYHPSYSWDRLGKNAGTYRFRNSNRGVQWKSYDPQHESINFLCAQQLLRPSLILQELVDDWIETALAQYPVDSGTYLDGLGGTRAIGRMTLAMLWAHCATGRQDILQRALDRLHGNYVDQAFSASSLVNVPPSMRESCQQPRRIMAVADNCPTITAELLGDNPEMLEAMTDGIVAGEVDALDEAASLLFVSGLFGPDGRTVPVPNWSPWQEAFVAQGFACLWRMTGDALALEAAYKVAETITLHGVREHDDGTFDVGGYLAYEDGQPLPFDAWDDPDRVKTYGTGVSRWILPAMDIASHLCRQVQQDPAVCTEVERRAGVFRDWVEGMRTPGGFDAVVPWDVFRDGVHR
jgi:hypothetical protein